MPTTPGNIQAKPTPALFEPSKSVSPLQKDFEDGAYFLFEDGQLYEFEN